MQALRCKPHRSDQYKGYFLLIKLITMLATQNSVFPGNYRNQNTASLESLATVAFTLHIYSAMINFNFVDVL